MPWVTGDKDKLMAALGYSISAETLAEVQAAMDSTNAIAPDMVTRVQGYLAEIVAIDAQIKIARNAASGLLGQLKSEGRRHVGLISTAMSLDSRNDFYSQ
jgi:PIN domain nuclease of toxin-antitoxin system